MSAVRRAAGLLALAAGLGAGQAQGAAALAIVNSESGYQYYWDGNRPTVQEAEDRVLNACARNAYVQRQLEPCRVVLSADGPAYYAVVKGSNGAIGYAKDEVEWGAVSVAADNCNQRATCANSASGLWYDSVVASRFRRMGCGLQAVMVTICSESPGAGRSRRPRP